MARMWGLLYASHSTPRLQITHGGMLLLEHVIEGELDRAGASGAYCCCWQQLCGTSSTISTTGSVSGIGSRYAGLQGILVCKLLPEDSRRHHAHWLMGPGSGSLEVAQACMPDGIMPAHVIA